MDAQRRGEREKPGNVRNGTGRKGERGESIVLPRREQGRAETGEEVEPTAGQSTTSATWNARRVSPLATSGASPTPTAANRAPLPAKTRAIPRNSVWKRAPVSPSISLGTAVIRRLCARMMKTP